MQYGKSKLTQLNRRCPRSARGGWVLLSYSLVLVALAGISSLAVDYGHMQLVKTQLLNTADAAARAGVAQLATGSSSTQIANAINAAIATAALNVTDNQPVVLQSSDIVVGNFDTTQTPNFSATRTPVNAMQVTARRQTLRGNPVYLTLAPIVGAQTCDCSVTSIASIAPPMSSYGIAGINSVNFASLGVAAKIVGDVASNGDISIGNPLGILVSVTHNAQSYSGYVSHGGLATIQGSTSPLSSSLYYPNVVVPTSNNNTNISSNLDQQSNFLASVSTSIPAGTYVVHDLNILAGVQLNLQGAVTFYVTGAVNIAASVNFLGNTNSTPSNFNVNVASGGTVNFLANIVQPLCMNLYAPQSAISINVSIGNFTGMLIGQSLNISLPAASCFTEVKPTNTSQAISLQS